MTFSSGTLGPENCMDGTNPFDLSDHPEPSRTTGVNFSFHLYRLHSFSLVFGTRGSK